MPDRDKWIYGKGKSKTTGYYSDYDAATQGQIPYYPSIPADWPWFKEYRRKYGKNVGVGKAVAELEDPIAYIKRLDKERKDRESKYRRQVKLGTEWKTRDMGWFVVLQDASHPGKVRIQRFDEDGFSGHMTFDNIRKLVDYLVEWESKLESAKGTLDKLSKTTRWDKGMKRLLGSNKNESMVFADQQTREEKNLLRKNRRKAAIEIDKALEAMEFEENSEPSSDYAEGLMKESTESISDVYTLIEAVVEGISPDQVLDEAFPFPGGFDTFDTEDSPKSPRVKLIDKVGLEPMTVDARKLLKGSVLKVVDRVYIFGPNGTRGGWFVETDLDTSAKAKAFGTRVLKNLIPYNSKKFTSSDHKPHKQQLYVVWSDGYEKVSR